MFMLNFSIIYNKIEKNKCNIYKVLLVLILILILFLSFNSYKNKKEKQFNQKLFEIVENYDSDLDLLNNLYINKDISENNKIFVGMILAKKYTQKNMYNEAIKIYNEIYLNSSDNFIIEYSGYNLLKLYIIQKDNEKILDLYNQLIKNNTDIIDLVKEQYILYLLDNNDIEQANNVINSINKVQDNKELFERIELYKNAYKLK